MAPGPKHLTIGDPLPPLQSGVLRVYSMKFCPFADRARLVLHAKGIEHEVINVNTWKKPEWFVQKNPKQLVPVLEKDGKIIYESIVVAQYLEDIYPEKNPLTPKDPYQRAKDAMLLDHYGGKTIPAFFGSRGGQNQEKVEELKISLQYLNNDLTKRGTDFFFGSKPGFLDYMMWPIFARLRASGPFGAGVAIPASLEILSAWYDGMVKDPSVKSITHPDSAYQEFSKNYRTENTMFDEIETEN